MKRGEKYLVKSPSGINTMYIITLTSDAMKVKWSTGISEWIYRDSFKARNKFVDPQYQILERN